MDPQRLAIVSGLLAIAVRQEQQAERCRAAAAVSTDKTAASVLIEAAIMLELHGWTESAFAELLDPTPGAP